MDTRPSARWLVTIKERLRRSPIGNRYTDWPKPAGERSLAIQLSSLNDEKLHLWFGVDYVPGVLDIDSIIWHELVGVFVVEVKALSSLDAVLKFGLDHCEIEGRPGKKTPQRQAYEACRSLIDFLAPQMRSSVPYLVSTACWPKISREEWRRRWDDQFIAEELSNRMLFEEDVFGSPKDLTDRLKYIRCNAPFRSGTNGSFRHGQKQFLEFKHCLDRTAAPKPAPSDLERLHTIEAEIKAETRKLVPLDKPTRVHFYGFPGTGKTFRLLQIGAYHASNQRRVLFSCFNKTLAADVRRMLSYSEKMRSKESGTLDAYDVFALLSIYAAQYNIDVEEGNENQWGEYITAELKARSSSVEKYDTVLIDEAQDMPDWMLELLELHIGEQATVCVASGNAQELYGKEGTWLKLFRVEAKEKHLSKELRRNFRNYRSVFQMAKIFLECGMNPKKIVKAAEPFKRYFYNNPLVPIFDRVEGPKPSLVRLDESMLEGMDESNPFFSDDQFECRVNEYRRIISEQLDRLEKNERPLDLLVLVPDRMGFEARYARAALQRLQTARPEVGYIDYADDKRRREIAQPNMVRLCTFHSSRGLEGHRVVIFGIERIEMLASQAKADPAKLGYIALSRSLFECVIVVRNLISENEQRVIRLLEAIRSEL